MERGEKIAAMMTPYPKYKPSGIEWIGEIPEHWDINLAKRYITYLTDYDANGSFSTIKDGVNRVEEKERKFAWFVRSTDLENLKDKSFDECVWVDESTYYFLKKSTLYGGELLIAKRGEIGKLYLMPFVNFPSTLAPNLYLVRFNETLLSKYAYYYYLSDVGNAQLIMKNNSTTLGALYKDDFKETNFIKPPISEQSKIATFLDQKTSQIDLLISNKQKLIGLLKEEKTAIINEAVTKGINKNAKLKPSGIEWLGDVPEHWEVKKLKYVVFKIGSGVTPSGGSSVYQTSGIPLLRSQNIHFDGLRLDDVAYISPEIDDSMKNSRVEPGDVLLNITGASIGRCFYLDEDFGKGNVNQHVCILRPDRKRVLTRYLYLILYSSIGQTQIDLLQTGANREGLNFEQLKNFSLPLPELNEQLLILNYFEKQRSKIDHAISRIEKEIELMQEYRTALISEVVTGKMRVS